MLLILSIVFCVHYFWGFGENMITMSNGQTPLQENTDYLSDSEKKMRSLEKMGYTIDEATIAMDRRGGYLNCLLQQS